MHAQPVVLTCLQLLNSLTQMWCRLLSAGDGLIAPALHLFIYNSLCPFKGCTAPGWQPPYSGKPSIQWKVPITPFSYPPGQGSRLCLMCGANTTNLEDGSAACPVPVLPGAALAARYAVVVSFGVFLNGTSLDDIAGKVRRAHACT